jgi:hypothetical protein
MGEVFAALDVVYTLLAAAALALTPFAHRELRAAQVLFIVIAVLIGTRWTMWAFSTDQTWIIRSIIGALFGAVLLGGLPALYSWAKERGAADTKRLEGSPTKKTDLPPANQNDPQLGMAESAAEKAPPAVLQLGNIGGAVKVEDNKFVADISKRSLVAIDSAAEVVIRGNSQLDSLPNPKATQAQELEALSNAQLRDALSNLTKQMRVVQRDFDAQRQNVMDEYRKKRVTARNPSIRKDLLTQEHFEDAKVRSDLDREFRKTFAPRANTIQGEILYRLKREGYSSIDLSAAQPDVRFGYRTLQSDSTAGASPLADMGTYLEFLAGKLRD